MSIFKQLLKEFWFPLLVAIFWTFYNFMSVPTTELAGKDVVNILAPTFFLVSWLLAQFFRVRNQQHVRTGLSSIKEEIIALDGLMKDRLETEKQSIIVAKQRRRSEGTPKFIAYKNRRLPPDVFSDNEKAQHPYFVDLGNVGRTVYNICFNIVGEAKLQIVQGYGKNDYIFEMPVWATDSNYRVVWTYGDSNDVSPAKLHISYVDTFGVPGEAVFAIEPVFPVEPLDEHPKVRIVEHIENEKTIHHSGEPDYGYDYNASDERSSILRELDKIHTEG